MELRLSLNLAKFLAKLKRFKWILLVTCILLLNSLIIIYKYHMDVVELGIDCVIERNEKNDSINSLLLNPLVKPLDDVLLRNRKPIPGRTIIFLETSCNHEKKPNILKLTARQACAIESAALHNPNLRIFVLFARRTYYPQGNHRKDQRDGSLIDAVLSYKNVQLRQLNFWTYVAGSPIEDWLKEGHLFRSSYLMNHMSDMLRLMSLYRFGGIYLDMDVVVLRSLEDVPLNFAGVESDKKIANGVMSLAPTGFGHKIAESCLLDFQQHFNGQDWGHNGPGLITRVAKRICNTTHITQLHENRERCQGFQFFDRNAFYAVPYNQWGHFFSHDSQIVEETLAQTKDSYLVHVWNKLSGNHAIKIGSRTAYGKLAEQNCPKSYAASGDYF